MKSSSLLLILISTALVLSVCTPLAAQPAFEPASSASPYFFVHSEDPSVDRLPLKSTDVKVSVSGVIADVVVRQVYTNEGRRPLEAIYIFPASTRAAVYAMTMRIGERTIEAKIEKREAARRIYEEARRNGQSASLLEQQRPNVFQMNVANILPGDEVAVELRYTELLVPLDGVYEFVYPTVVGPRYVSDTQEAAAGENWAANPYLHQGEAPTSTFAIGVSLQAGLPIQDLFCGSHRVTVDYRGPDRADLALDPGDTFGGNRDFILKYRLSGQRIETGVLLYEGDGENFFLAMVQPPREVALDRIPPRDYVFIVDVSGSMNGFPLEVSKELLVDLIGGLRPTDSFNVILFAGASRLMAPRSLPATAENIRRAVDLIDRQRGGGGTELLPALRRALDLPRTEGVARTLVIATDGYVTVETEAFDLIRRRLGDATMIPFGIGSSVNRYLIEGLARTGMGEPFVVTEPAHAKKAAADFRKLIATPVATGIGIDYGAFDVYDVEPPAIPDLLAQRPVVVFGKYRGTAGGRMVVTGTCGRIPFERSIDLDGIRPSLGNRALRYLWARHRIAILSDYNGLRPDDARTREITELGLTYNLLTQTTSFVAVDSRRRNTDGSPVTVKQPLPLPQGVSDLAVGRAAPGVATMKMMVSPPSAPTEADAKELHRADGEPHSQEASAGKGERSLKLALESVQALGFPLNEVCKILEGRLERIAERLSVELGIPPDRFGAEISVDTAGRIVSVVLTFPPDRKDLESSLAEAFKDLVFPAPAGSRGGRIEVIFRLK